MTIIFVMDFGRGEPVNGEPIVKRIITLVKEKPEITAFIKRTQLSLSRITSSVI
jgi:hypothetical protein